MLKGTPLPIKKARGFTKERRYPFDCGNAWASSVKGQAVIEIAIDGQQHGIELDTDDAQLLVAVLLQFIADAEAS